MTIVVSSADPHIVHEPSGGSQQLRLREPTQAQHSHREEDHHRRNTQGSPKLKVSAVVDSRIFRRLRRPCASIRTTIEGCAAVGLVFPVRSRSDAFLFESFWRSIRGVGSIYAFIWNGGFAWASCAPRCFHKTFSVDFSNALVSIESIRVCKH